MKKLFRSLSEVERKIRISGGCLLILDFDGTLSPLSQTPAKAFLPKTNKEILKKINCIMPVAIVSGRSLRDIKQKVGIKDLIYAGNHGMEWQIGSKQGKIKIPANKATAMASIGKQFNNLKGKYPGVLLENKGLTLSLHYRLTDFQAAKQLLKEAKQLIRCFQKQRLIKATGGKKVFEVRPYLAWDKGRWVEFLCRRIGKRMLPIYIGDDATDEAVFKILKTGITVKVGKNSNSAAEYYCEDNKQTRSFLVWLLKSSRKNSRFF